MRKCLGVINILSFFAIVVKDFVYFQGENEREIDLTLNWDIQYHQFFTHRTRYESRRLSKYIVLGMGDPSFLEHFPLSSALYELGD